MVIIDGYITNGYAKNKNLAKRLQYRLSLQGFLSVNILFLLYFRCNKLFRKVYNTGGTLYYLDNWTIICCCMKRDTSF